MLASINNRDMNNLDLISWSKFFSLLGTLDRLDTILIVSEANYDFKNKQFWLITHRRQFQYLETLSCDAETLQVWSSVEFPTYSGAADGDIQRSLTNFPQLVIFILGKQLYQFLSFIRFFDNLCIPFALIQAGFILDLRYDSQKFAAYFLLKSHISLVQVKNFVHFLLSILKRKEFIVATNNLDRLNATFTTRVSFLAMLERWSSVTRGIQLVDKRQKKKRWRRLTKNKRNFRFLNKA